MQARLVLASATCAALAALTGCSAPAEAPAPPAATADVGLDEAAAAVAGIPPRPSAPVAAAYLADLRAINPEIVGDKNPDRLIDRGRDQCGSIHDWPRDEDKVFELARARFTSPTHPDGFDVATTTKIVQTVRKHLCPTY